MSKSTLPPRPALMQQLPEGRFLFEVARQHPGPLQSLAPNRGALGELARIRAPLSGYIDRCMQAGAIPQLAAMVVNEAIYALNDGVLIEVAPQLAQMLLDTDLDLATQMTAQDVRLPFDRPMYLALPPIDHGLSTGDDDPPLDGCYLRRARAVVETTSQDGFEPGTYESIEIVAVTLPDDLDEPMAGSFSYMAIAWPENSRGRTIDQLIEDREKVLLATITRDPDQQQRLRERFMPILQFVLKTLLYMNLPESRFRQHNEASDLLARVNGLGPKKKARLLRRAQQAYDRIIIGEDEQGDTAPANGDDQARTVTAHLRRGHFRRVHYGAGRSKTRITWIKPTVVAYRPTDACAPSPKSYQLGSG